MSVRLNQDQLRVLKAVMSGCHTAQAVADATGMSIPAVNGALRHLRNLRILSHTRLDTKRHCWRPDMVPGHILAKAEAME